MIQTHTTFSDADLAPRQAANIRSNLIGARVKVIAGQYAGNTGTVESIDILSGRAAVRLDLTPEAIAQGRKRGQCPALPQDHLEILAESAPAPRQNPKKLQVGETATLERDGDMIRFRLEKSGDVAITRGWERFGMRRTTKIFSVERARRECRKLIDAGYWWW